MILDTKANMSAAAIVSSSDIKNNPLRYDRYRDLENQVTNEELIQFIRQTALDHKANHEEMVSHRRHLLTKI